MVLTIDGVSIEISQGMSILDALRTLTPDEDASLKTRPLAARIDGEIYSLNYTPYRDTELHLLRYSSEEGKRVYERTLQFIFLAAIDSLYPSARVKIRYTLGAGLYTTIEKRSGSVTEEDADAIAAYMKGIIQARMPLMRKRLPISEALDYFESKGQADKSALLKWRRFSYFDVYTIDNGYMDYYYGEMAPDTGYAHVFDIHYLNGDILLLVPDAEASDRASKYEPHPKLAAVFRESDYWDALMDCSTVSELNEHVTHGSIRELVRVNEALHEKRYANIADKIVEQKARAILIAGPSSSGKTTSANRLSTQLRVLGQHPVMLSLDDYYMDRTLIPSDANGEKDFEHIDTIDIQRFNTDLSLLLRGEEVETPLFDFTTGCRRSEGRIIKLHANEPLIIEGIHALNPKLIRSKGSLGINETHLFRIYVSALTTLNLDDHNRIRTTDVRLLRRLVRDNFTRSTPVEKTFSMWTSVRRGEEKWIFPHQEDSDVLLNTTLVYEIAVLKKYIYPLLLRVPKSSQHFTTARNLIKFLNYFVDADVEDDIPPTSILREFIGGNTFYR